MLLIICSCSTTFLCRDAPRIKKLYIIRVCRERFKSIDYIKETVLVNAHAE